MDNLEKDSRQDKMIMPGDSDKDYSELISEDIVDNISRKQVSTVLIKEQSEMQIPSYLIDLSKVQTVLECSLIAITSMLNKEFNGDISVYIKTKQGVFGLGKGDSVKLSRYLTVFLKATFGDDVGVYKNIGNGFKRINVNDVSNVLLEL